MKMSVFVKKKAVISIKKQWLQEILSIHARNEYIERKSVNR